jgi:C4-dicarboxylate-specific signal transduction histidine kinase
MNPPLRVLFVEDSADDAELLRVELIRCGFDLAVWRRVDAASEMTAALLEDTWDLILCDYSIPGFGGLQALALVKGLGLDMPFILVSGVIGEEAAVEAMRCGANDYLMKDRLARLVPAIRRELAEVVVRQEKRRAQQALREANEALEAKVEERTAELSRTNLSLRKEIVERERMQRERDRMAAELLQGQKLQAIGQLSAGIAHEINNPLSYILSNLKCLNEALQGSPPGRETLAAEFRGALADSLEGAERIRRIVQGLREFAHLDERELRTVDLRSCIENALRLCANEVGHKARVVRTFENLPLVRCYPQQIEQVLVNLIMNAVQAIPEQGEIGVEARSSGTEAVIRVRDTGSGIAPEHLEKLFEPFFTTKPVGRGTGLGLHVAYKIAKAHGGRIDVVSKPGEGSEFSVFLPVAGPAAV